MMTQSPNKPPPVRVQFRADLEPLANSFASALRCPVCGCSDHIHLGPVDVEQGSVRVIAANDTVQRIATDRGRRKPGSRVSLMFACMVGGHVWTWELMVACNAVAIHMETSDALIGPPPLLWEL